MKNMGLCLYTWTLLQLFVGPNSQTQTPPRRQLPIKVVNIQLCFNPSNLLEGPLLTA